MSKSKKVKRSKNDNKTFLKKIEDDYLWDNATIGIFFLGVGSILFIINITTMLHAVQYVKYGLSMTGFYGSTLGSLIIMLYSLYNIYATEEEN
jgi:hypothetical protein